jgi:sulfide:quinone oxidoreductase
MLPSTELIVADGSGNGPRIVVAGGGVAGLEAVLALRDWLGDSGSIDLISPHDGFVYRPLAVAEPFALTTEFEIDLHGFCRDTEATFHRGGLEAVNPGSRTATIDDEAFSFDKLIVATGARALPGLPDAFTFTGRDSVEAYRHLLYRVERGEIGSLAFAVPEGPRWLLPIYELALMTAVFARARLAQPQLALVTPEALPLEYFGVDTGREVIRTLQEWGVELVPEHRVIRFEKPNLETDRDFTIVADAVVSLPRLAGPGLAGLPTDEEGFVEVSSQGQVSGCEGVFAAGDATTFPIKHGGIAAQHADAVAEVIAAELGLIAEPAPFRPSLDAVLLSGEMATHLHRSLATGTTSPAREQAGDAWWPLGKVAARHLGSYLAARASLASTTPAIESDPLAEDLKASQERGFQTRVGDEPGEPG